VIKYCTKENDYISSMSKEEIEQKIGARKDKSKILGESLMKEGLTAKIIEENP